MEEKNLSKFLKYRERGKRFKKQVPVEHLAHGYTERLSSPIFATCVGLLMKGVQDLEEGKLEARLQAIQNEHRKGAYEGGPEVEGNRWYEQLFKKTKEWFEAEPDAEF